MKAPRLSLELLCGSADVDPQHPGWFEGRFNEPHPKQVEIATWAEANGMSAFVEVTKQDGTWFSDAYLYFEPKDIRAVAKKLRSIGYYGDILDVKGRLSTKERLLILSVAKREGWRIG